MKIKRQDTSIPVFSYVKMCIRDSYKVKPKFYVINFDDPRRSHRCNPIHPDFMEDITDAYELSLIHIWYSPIVWKRYCPFRAFTVLPTCFFTSPADAATLRNGLSNL